MELEDVYYVFKYKDLFVTNVSLSKIEFSDYEFKALKVYEDEGNSKYTDRQNVLNRLEQINKHGFQVDVIRHEAYIERKQINVGFHGTGETVLVGDFEIPKIDIIELYETKGKEQGEVW